MIGGLFYRTLLIKYLHICDFLFFAVSKQTESTNYF